MVLVKKNRQDLDIHVIKKKAAKKEIQKKQINIQKCLKISLTDKEKLICQARMKNNLIKITV